MIDDEIQVEAPSVDEIETKLVLDGSLKADARQIPLDMVTPHEAYILSSYLNDELGDEDIDELRKILEQYRPALMKYEPEQTMENLEHNIELVEDEKYFLDLVDNYDKIQVIPLTMFVGNKEIRMKFDLYPLLDSVAIEDITQNLEIFKNFSEDELETYNKMQTGQQLTREELIIKAGLERKIQRATQENQKEIITQYLSMQLKFHNKDNTIEEMEQVFNKFNTTYLYLLFNEVQKRNHLNDIQADKVFQEFD